MLNNIEQLKEFANFIFFKKYKDFYNKSTKEALIKKIVLFVKAKCFVVKEADFSNKNNPTIRSNVDLIEKAYKEDISDLHKIINFIKICFAVIN